MLNLKSKPVTIPDYNQEHFVKAIQKWLEDSRTPGFYLTPEQFSNETATALHLGLTLHSIDLPEKLKEHYFDRIESQIRRKLTHSIFQTPESHEVSTFFEKFQKIKDQKPNNPVSSEINSPFQTLYLASQEFQLKYSIVRKEEQERFRNDRLVLYPESREDPLIPSSRVSISKNLGVFQSVPRDVEYSTARAVTPLVVGTAAVGAAALAIPEGVPAVAAVGVITVLTGAITAFRAMYVYGKSRFFSSVAGTVGGGLAAFTLGYTAHCLTNPVAAYFFQDPSVSNQGLFHTFLSALPIGVGLLAGGYGYGLVNKFGRKSSSISFYN